MKTMVEKNYSIQERYEWTESRYDDEEQFFNTYEEAVAEARDRLSQRFGENELVIVERKAVVKATVPLEHNINVETV